MLVWSGEFALEKVALYFDFKGAATYDFLGAQPKILVAYATSWSLTLSPEYTIWKQLISFIWKLTSAAMKEVDILERNCFQMQKWMT